MKGWVTCVHYEKKEKWWKEEEGGGVNYEKKKTLDGEEGLGTVRVYIGEGILTERNWV